MTNTGTIIKKRRLELKLSQAELARRTGYADKTGISKIESGARQLTPDKIKVFADALDMDPRDLLPDVWSRPMTDAPLVLTEDEKIIIHQLRMIPEEDRKAVLRVLDMAVSAFERSLAEDSEDAGV